MGIPDEPFWAPDGPRRRRTATPSRERVPRGQGARGQEALDALDADERAAWDAAWHGTGTKGWEDALPTFEQGEKIATRQAMAKVLGAVLDRLPRHGLRRRRPHRQHRRQAARRRRPADAPTTPAGARSTTASASTPWARRSSAWPCTAAILPISGTFFVFLDYMRPPVRLAALSRAKVVFVFSHDSVGVGEDGPTHQPVEHLATLRAIPGLQVIRPADANETAAALRAAVDHDGPTALVLTRQGVAGVHRRLGRRARRRHRRATRRRPGARHRRHRQRGRRSPSTPPSSSPPTASPTRVVSLPSWDRFAAQDAEYREQLLPAGVPVLSVEAATTFGWERYADDSIGIDRFGVSAPGDEVLERLGINVDHVVERGPRARWVATAPEEDARWND